MRRERFQATGDVEEDIGTDTDEEPKARMLHSQEKRHATARQVDAYPHDTEAAQPEVQLTISVPTKELGNLLLDVAREGERHRHQQREYDAGSEEVPAPSPSVVHPAALISPSVKQAGTTPRPDKDQALPAPSPMPKADTSDDALVGIEYAIGFLVVCSFCCAGCYWGYKKYTMRGDAQAGYAGPGGPFLPPAMQQQGFQPGGKGSQPQRSYRQTRKKGPDVAQDAGSGEAPDANEAYAEAANIFAASAAADATEEHY